MARQLKIEYKGAFYQYYFSGSKRSKRDGSIFLTRIRGIINIYGSKEFIEKVRGKYNIEAVMRQKKGDRGKRKKKKK